VQVYSGPKVEKQLFPDRKQMGRSSYEIGWPQFPIKRPMASAAGHLSCIALGDNLGCMGVFATFTAFNLPFTLPL